MLSDLVKLFPLTEWEAICVGGNRNVCIIMSNYFKSHVEKKLFQVTCSGTHYDEASPLFLL